MINLNYNLNKTTLGRVGCTSKLVYNYSASISVVGGGGGGNSGTSYGIGGGGGGGMAVSQSISICPNLTYQIKVGGGGAVDNKGQDSSLIGFDDNDIYPIAFYAQGGNAGTFDGGNSGTGSIVRDGIETFYPAKLGGSGSYSFDSFGPKAGGGGGASNSANGGAANSGVPYKGGDGANGFSAGGGGGWTGAGPTGPIGTQGVDGTAFSGFGAGGHGQGGNPGGGAANAGSNGAVIISYPGLPKAFVTNATTTFVDGNTIHTFNSGSGTFLYTFPYPWQEPVIPYTVEECPPETNPPFLPQPRVDPYSSSLVLAIPGAIFKNGYVNVFNQVSEYDDISAYIVSGSILNPNTGKYYQLATNQNVILTGSYGSYSASFDVNNFLNDGYRTSLFFTGSVACTITASGNAGGGLNLTSSKSFTIESWIAFPATASFATASGSVQDPIIVVNAIPNRVVAQKYQETIPASSSYLYVAGWNGNTAPFGNPRGFTPVSGSSIFYVDYKTSLLEDRELSLYPVSSSGWTPYQWKHYAVSLTAPTGSSDNAIYRQYIDGKLISQVANRVGINFTPTTPIEIFGESNPFIDPFNEASASQVAGAFFQDLRIYNGTNKNYTGSQFTPPLSMIISELEPYPQYNL
jgi:hypothetical protein